MLIRALFAAVAVAGATTGCTGSTAPPAGAPPVAPTSAIATSAVATSTTKIASAGVLGNQRRPDESCAPQPARPDGAPDPMRIVALAGDELDALCALGLQGRIVAAAVPDGAAGQPSYLGTVIHQIPAAGTRSAPDLAAITAARPDLILGSQSLAPQAHPALTAIAPTVFTAAPGARWRENLRQVGAATGRARAADELIAGFAEQARNAGQANDAAHFQASVVQLTDTTLRVWGADSFAGSVLAAVGVDRPAAQRFTDRPYLEIDLDGSPDLSAADGDIVYLSFDSPAARDRAPGLLASESWRKLSANRDNRVFVVNNEVWQSGQGIVAARGIVEDLRWLNAPIN